ncbi:MAG TPA: UdgX family uracil-DNA binding protein [Acetobacteraceae bacterium]|nr:UdgX family uracil-DNA binding protein [Acetobacteraceae bacterium]
MILRSAVLAHQVDWDGWRGAARGLALAGVPPEHVAWSVQTPDDLFAGAAAEPAAASPVGTFNVPRALVALAETVIQARDPERFALLYRLIWRAHAGERQILEQITDPDVHRAQRLAQAVRDDTQKIRAFLRLREVQQDGATRCVAWFEPSHYIVEANAAFFVRRFATMTWSILTPYRSAHWNGVEVTFGPGAEPSDVPGDDRLAEHWRVHFASIFNPARLRVAAMPRKYWKNLPEAAAIPELVRTAESRVQTMVKQPVISPERPNDPLAQAAADAAGCRRCDLWERATQTVFGEGPPDALMMLVGEQPGDQEDLAGRPFVGPAGQLLDRALAEAGVDRDRVYVTNAVKHFKFEPRGKRRIHAKPDAGEIAACRFWLDLERAEVRPRLTVMLGASAARAVLGRAVTIARERGRAIPLDGTTGFVTVHPSYLLRLPDADTKAREYAAFVRDLRAAAALV